MARNRENQKQKHQQRGEKINALPGIEEIIVKLAAILYSKKPLTREIR